MEYRQQSSFGQDLLRYTNILIQRWWVIVIAVLLAGVSAYVISKRTTPVYQAITTILINEAPATKTTDYTAIVTSERLAQTYSQLMSKTLVLEGVIEQLNLDLKVTDLDDNLFIQPIRDTTLIEVRYEDTDPERALEVANSLVAVFSEQNQELQSSRYLASKTSLETQLATIEGQIQKDADLYASLEDNEENLAERSRLDANLSQYRQTYAYLLQSYEQVRLVEAQSTSNIVQVEPATVPEKPIRPRTFTNTLMAVVVAGMLAVGGIFLFEALDDTLKGPDDVTSQIGYPVLGVIAKHDTEKNLPITHEQPRSPVSEAFRALRTNIQYASVDKPVKTILVTSPSPAEGKSTIAVNLGIVLAQNDRKVLVIDADLRRPKVHSLLKLVNTDGLSDLFVSNGVPIESHFKETCTQGLYALLTGKLPPNPSELLGSEKMRQILAEAEQYLDLVVIDSPPVMAVTDPAVMAPIVDGVVMVVKPGISQMAVIKQSVEMLQRGGVIILGFVLNEVDFRGSRNYYYKGYYYASKDYNHSTKTPNRFRAALKKWRKK